MLKFSYAASNPLYEINRMWVENEKRIDLSVLFVRWPTLPTSSYSSEKRKNSAHAPIIRVIIIPETIKDDFPTY